MIPDDTDRMDAVDLLLKIGMFVCFVVFGLCMWFIKRERDKRKASGGQNAAPPKTPNG
jgi:hypothetical protein